MRRIIAAAAAAAALTVLAAPAAAEPRVKVYVLQYVSPGDSNNHPYFTLAIRDRLALLRSQIAPGRASTRYLQGLVAVPRPTEAPGSSQAMLSRWRSSDALVMMWGKIEPIQSGALVATSSIYLGDLTAREDLRQIELARMDLRADAHEAIKDLHSYVAAYALLLDARRDGAPRDAVLAILASLNNIYARLRANLYRPPELPRLKASVDQIAAEMRAAR